MSQFDRIYRDSTIKKVRRLVALIKYNKNILFVDKFHQNVNLQNLSLDTVVALFCKITKLCSR